MSICIKTNTIKKELTTEQFNHIRFLLCPYDTLSYDFDDMPGFLENEFRCYMPFAYRDSNGKFHGYSGFIRTDGSDDGLDDLFELTDVDIYCSPQGYKKYSRKMEDLLSFQNLIIDLDYHGDDITISELNSYLRKLVPKLLSNMPIKPNFINYTGRGLHFWFCIEPCHVKLIKYVENCLEALSMMVGSALRKCDANTMLKLDAGASNRLTGFFRVPYTYNQNAKIWSTGKLLHKKRPNVVAFHKSLCKAGFPCYSHLPEWAKELYNSKNYKHQKLVAKSHRSIKHSDYTPCFMYRKRVLDRIISTYGIVEGHRHGILLSYYLACLNLYDDAAYSRSLVESLNEIAEPSLSCDELESIFTNCDKNVQRYRYTQPGFYELIGYPEDSIPKKPTKKEIAKQKVQERKFVRDNEILRLHSLNIPIAEIARTIGCSRPTVYKVISYLPFD